VKLLWSARSPFVRKVMIAATEVGVADRITCEPMPIGQPGINETVLAANPVGKIPVLMLDDHTPITDSRVICEYLDSLHDDPVLFPQGPERWHALRWQALGDGLLEQILAWRNESLRSDGERSDAWAQGHRKRVMAGFDRVEREAPAIANAAFSIGHIAIGCFLGFADYRYPDLDWRSERPALSKWFADFVARDSVQAHPANPDAADARSAA